MLEHRNIEIGHAWFANKKNVATHTCQIEKVGGGDKEGGKNCDKKS